MLEAFTKLGVVIKIESERVRYLTGARVWIWSFSGEISIEDCSLFKLFFWCPYPLVNVSVEIIMAFSVFLFDKPKSDDFSELFEEVKLSRELSETVVFSFRFIKAAFALFC